MAGRQFAAIGAAATGRRRKHQPGLTGTAPGTVKGVGQERQVLTKNPPRWRGDRLDNRNAPVVGGFAGGSTHPQSCQAIPTTPASAVLAEASGGVKFVALTALANLFRLPSLLSTLLL